MRQNLSPRSSLRECSDMAVLVVADHDGTHLRDTTAKTVSAAGKLSGEIDILVYGEGVGAVAAQAADIAGVRKVITSESAALKADIAEAVSALVMSLADGYDV